MTSCDTECALRVQAAVSEEMEQRRRLLDKNGEIERKLLAQQVSRLIPRYSVLKNVPPPVERKFLILEAELVDEKSNILNQGWEAIKKAAEAVTNATYVSADVVTQAAVDAMEKVGAKTAEMMSQIGHTTTDIMDKTGNATIKLTHKTSDVVEHLVDKTAIAAHNTADAAAHLGHQIVDTTAQVATSLAHTASDKATVLGHQIADTTTQVATSLAHTASEKGTVIAHQIVDVSGEAAHKAAELASQAATQIGHAVEDTIHKIQDIKEDIAVSQPLNDVTRLYVRAQETVEQARRMASGEEQCAVLNALFVSSLIQDLGISFYKQTGVNRWYAIKLLENMEMKWRLFHELDGFAVTNAKKESRLISQRFESLSLKRLVQENISATTQPEGLPIKVAVVEVQTIEIAPNAPAGAAQ